MYIVELINDKIVTKIHSESVKLKNGTIVQGINTIDSFSFSIFPLNPGFDRVYDYKTLVRAYNSNKKRYDFYGRVLYSAVSMDENGYIYKEVTCESYLGFLYDSQQPYVEEKNWTVMGLLKYLITQHNSQVESYKKFTVGEVTVTDPNDNLYLGIQRTSTWKAIDEKLVSKLGGEIRFRVVDDVTYIDYLIKIGSTRVTTIELSKNMKKITRENDPTAYVTRLIPLGAKLSKEVVESDEDGNETVKTVETEERLEITSVNEGKNYIDDETAISVYGIHVGYQIWDDVTTASALLKKGQDWLADNNKVKTKYSITALDLSLLGIDIDDLAVCDSYPVVNPLLGIDDTARIIKKTINICNEVESTIEVGDSFKTLSDLLFEQNNALKDSVDKIGSTVNTLQDKVSSTQNSVNELNTKVEGIDGTYFYIRYSAYSDGHIMTDSPQDDTEYMGTCSTNSDTAPVDYKAYTWCRIKGDDGTDGTPGVNGISQYFHVKYSDDGETFTSNQGEMLGDWMGTLVDSNPVDSTVFSDYEWHKIRGEAGLPGKDGIAGADGKDGRTTYFHIKYSAVENPTTASQMTETPSAYIGTYVDYTEEDSNDPADYKWMKFQGSDGIDGKDGTDGIPGENGADGQTYYLHIKYSNDGGKTFTANSGEDSGDWIGVYTDTTQADSTDVTKYTWTKIKGEQGPKGNKGEDGTSVTIKGSMESASSLPASGNTAGDGYIVNGDLYVWDGEKWNNVGAIQGPAGDSAYMHIKYSDDGGKTFTANNGETVGKYFGVYADNTEADSNNPADYKWTKMEGEDGKDGITYYTWIKYAETPTSGMSDNPEGKTYMGLAYNKTSPTESTNYSDYTWSLIKGEDGSDGVNGIDGIDGVTYYTWVKYADDANGTNMSDDPDGKYYIGLAYNKTTPTESTKASDYTWSLFRGADGVDGKDGADGISQYFYVRYSANANGNPMTLSPASDTKYMGVCSTTSPTAPTSYTDYTWTQCKGNDGTDGTPGEPGADGKTQYLHIKYSNDGKTFTGNRLSTDFSNWRQGSYSSGSTATAGEEQNYGTNGWNYISITDVMEVSAGEKWLEKTGDANVKFTRIRYDTDGNFLSAGQISPGTGSSTYTIPSGVGYMRIALYSTVYTTEDAWREAFENGSLVPEFRNTAEVAGEELGDWIGTLVNFEQKDSEVFTDYTWKKFTDDVDDELEEIRQTIVEQSTSLTNTCEQIVMEATEKYVEKTTFEEYKEETSSQFAIQSDEMSMKFTETQENIESVNGELQTTKEEWNKYFRFSIDGLEIGEEGNALTLKLDNDRIAFVKNGVVIAYWDGDLLRTGNLYVEVNERAQFGDFAYVPRTDGTLMFLKVGGA